MPVQAPFTLKSAVDNKSGTSYRDLYTVPAGTQAFIKSVIASNTANSSITPTLQLQKANGDTVQLASPSLATGAASNLLAGTILMSAGDKLRQKSTLDYISTGAALASQVTFPQNVSAQSFDIARGNGVIVVVGSSSSGTDPYNNFVVTSSDGITWTWRDIAPSDTTAYTLNSVTYGNGLFVAVGSSGAIFTSPDGVTWTKRTAAISGNLNSVVWGKDKFVCVCDGATGASIQTSPDGITWTARTGAVATTTSTNQVVAYDATRDMYAASTGNAFSGGTGIQTSPDGITWTARNVPSGIGNSTGIVGLNGKFIARGSSSDLVISNDGATWARLPTSFSNNTNYPNTMKSANGRVFFFRNGSLYISSDGVSWDTVTVSIGGEAATLFDGTGYFVLSLGGFSIYKVTDLSKSGSTACSFTASAIEVSA